MTHSPAPRKCDVDKASGCEHAAAPGDIHDVIGHRGISMH